MRVLVFIIAAITTGYGLIKNGNPWWDWLIVMPAIAAGVIAFTAETWRVTIIATTIVGGLMFLATHNLIFSIGLWCVMIFIGAIRGPE